MVGLKMIEEMMAGYEWWEHEKKLSNETPLLLLPKLATSLGLNEAIILQQLHYKLFHSPIKKNGHKWYYHTYSNWQEVFPFWSECTIKRTFSRLEKQGIIVSTQKYNTMRVDKTKWYRIDYETLCRIIGRQNEPTS